MRLLPLLSLLLSFISLSLGQGKKLLACLPDMGWNDSMCQSEYDRARSGLDSCVDNSNFALNCCLYCYKQKKPPTRLCRNEEGYSQTACKNLLRLIKRSNRNMERVLYYLAIEKCFGTLYCVEPDDMPFPYTLEPVLKERPVQDRKEIKYMEEMPGYMTTKAPAKPNALVKNTTVAVMPTTTTAKPTTTRRITTVRPTTRTTLQPTTTETPTTATAAAPEEMPAPGESFPGPSSEPPAPFEFPSTKKGILSKFLPGGEWFPIRFGRRGNPNNQRHG